MLLYAICQVFLDEAKVLCKIAQIETGTGMR